MTRFLIASLIAGVVSTVVGCVADGPRGSVEPGEKDGSAGDTVPTPEDRVQLRVSGRAVTFRGPAQVHAECISGHKGFGATVGGDRLSLNVFIVQPGRYRCDDPLPYIFLAWQNREATGEYEFAATRPTGGSCELVVESVHPRLTATFTATLQRARGDGPEEQLLTDGTLDVAMPDAARCP